MNVYGSWEEDRGKNQEKTKHPLSQERVAEDFPSLTVRGVFLLEKDNPLQDILLIEISGCYKGKTDKISRNTTSQQSSYSVPTDDK